MQHALRKIFTGLAWTFVGVFALLASIWVHLYTEEAREVVRRYALEAINGALAGEIQVERIAELGPRRIELDDVTIRDPAGRAVIHAARVRVEPRLSALLEDTLRIDHAHLGHGFVRLDASPGGGLAIATAFAPAHPSPPSGTGPSLSVVIDGIRIDDVDVSAENAPVGLHATRLRGSVDVRSGDATITVRDGHAVVLRQGRRIGRIARLGGVIRTAAGARSHVDLALGLEQVAAGITTPVRGRIHAQGTFSNLSASARLTTDAGPIDLRARLSDMRRLHATVRTRGLKLADLGPAAPSAHIRGEIEADLTPIGSAPRRFVLDLRRAAIDGHGIPPVHVEGALATDHVTVDRARASYHGGHVQVRGRVGFDGDVQGHLEARVPRLSRMPELRRWLGSGTAGALKADADLHYRSAPRAQLSVQGEITLAHARIAQVGAQRLRVHLDARGRPTRPELATRATASGLHVGSFGVGEVRLTADGGPERYRIGLRVRGPDGQRAQLAGRLRLARGAYDLSIPSLKAELAGRRWSGRIESVQWVPSRRVQLRAFELDSNGQHLEASGTYELGTRPILDAKVTVRRVDLSMLTELGVAPVPVHGSLDATVAARGRATMPDVTVRAAWTNGEVRGVSIDSGSVDARWQPDGSLRARVEAVGDHGKLASVWGNARVSLPELLKRPNEALAASMRGPWDLHARIPAQRLDRAPAWITGDSLGVPAQVWATADVSREPSREPTADVRAGVTWLGPLGPTAEGSGGCCSRAARPSVQLAAHLERGEADVQVHGAIDGRQVLRGRLTGAVPAGRWLRTGLPSRPPPLDAELRITDARLDDIPLVCAHASGRVFGRLQARGLFTARPSADLSLRSPGIAVMQASAVRVDATAHADARRLEAAVRLGAESSQDHTELTASLPVTWGGPSHPLPSLQAGGSLHADLTAHHTPLGPLLAAVPGIGSARGEIDGHVVAEGPPGPALQLHGTLDLHDAEIGIVSTGNRLTDVHGKLRFEGQTIRIDRLEAHDGGGKATLDGTLALEGFAPKRTRLSLEADRFPVREAGVVLGRLTANAHATARFGPHEGRMQVELAQVQVQLLRLNPPKLQSLEPNPDVIVVGVGSPRRAEPRRAQQPSTASSEPYRLVIDVSTKEPFWVRRSDMTAEARVNLRVVVERSTRISGQVDLLGGYFELVGKRFALERGRIQFTGATKTNPVVDITAKYDAGGGETLTIHVGGRVNDPQLSFSSSDGKVHTLGEAVAMLLGGQAGSAEEQNLAQQAASVVAGVTAGILTAGLRHELGGMVPVISVEATGQGGTVRAGINADRLIPEFLRNVVKSAYVEGFVTTTTRAGASGSTTTTVQPQGNDTRAGVTLRLWFPHRLNGSVTIEPPQSWSLDVLWEP